MMPCCYLFLFNEQPKKRLAIIEAVIIETITKGINDS